MQAQQLFVYAAQRPSGDRAVKLGISAAPVRRAGALAQATGMETVLLGVKRGDVRTLRQLQEKFAHLHIAGGWYQPDAALAQLVAREFAPLVKDPPRAARALFCEVCHRRIAHKARGRLPQVCDRKECRQAARRRRDAARASAA